MRTPNGQTLSLECAGSPLDQRSLTWWYANILIEQWLSVDPQPCDHGYSLWSPWRAEARHPAFVSLTSA